MTHLQFEVERLKACHLQLHIDSDVKPGYKPIVCGDLAMGKTDQQCTLSFE